jgi:hypothetical protein
MMVKMSDAKYPPVPIVRYFRAEHSDGWRVEATLEGTILERRNVDTMEQAIRLARSLGKSYRADMWGCSLGMAKAWQTPDGWRYGPEGPEGASDVLVQDLYGETLLQINHGAGLTFIRDAKPASSDLRGSSS